MTFKQKLLDRYHTVEARTMEIFRGVKDIYPSQVNHRFDGDGVFGRGTYYALQEHVAEQYATGHIGLEPFGRFALIFGYDVSPKNPLTLTPKIAKGLTSGSGQNIELSDRNADKYGMMTLFPRERLGESALQSDFDAVILKSTDHQYSGIDGEEQMLIPKGSDLKPKVKWVDVIFNDEDEDLAEEIAKKVGGNITTLDGHVKLVNTPLTKIKELSKLLEKTSNSKDYDGHGQEEDD